LEKPISKGELDILLAVSSLQGNGRYGEVYRSAGGPALSKETFQKRLRTLCRKGILKHKKVQTGPLGESWFSLTAKGKRMLAGMSLDPWQNIMAGYENALKSGKISEPDKPAYIEKVVEDLLDGAFKTARKLTLAAGLEDNLARREGLKIYVIEHWLGNLIRRLVDLLHENRAHASKKLKQLARPIETVRLE